MILSLRQVIGLEEPIGAYGIRGQFRSYGTVQLAGQHLVFFRAVIHGVFQAGTSTEFEHIRPKGRCMTSWSPWGVRGCFEPARKQRHAPRNGSWI